VVRALNNNQPIVLAAMLFLDNEDIFDEEGKVGSATISTAERGMKIGLTSEPTGARRGQGDDDDGGYATLPPPEQIVQKDQTWKARWGASTMSSPRAHLTRYTI